MGNHVAKAQARAADDLSSKSARWTRWLLTARDGLQEFTPYEPRADGSIDVVVGMCLLSSVDAVIDDGAERIVHVDDIWDLGNPRLVFDKTEKPTAEIEERGAGDSTPQLSHRGSQP